MNKKKSYFGIKDERKLFDRLKYDILKKIFFWGVWIKSKDSRKKISSAFVQFGFKKSQKVLGS